MIFNVVFFVVLISMLVQGTTTPTVVRRLGLEADGPAWTSIAEALPLDEPGVDLAELIVTSDLEIVGKSLAEYPPASGVLVIAILRDGDAVLPTGSTVILDEDVLVLSLDVDRVGISDVTAWARGEADSTRQDSPA